jgi:2-hydroxy-3-keto-5-methylthiopentenyl-1-phosphate phosphatase
MTAPNSSPFYCLELGVDKAGVVRFCQQRAERVAFAGDGFADLPAARLVAPKLRFARSDLANSLAAEESAYRPYQSWSDMAQQLLAPRME